MFRYCIYTFLVLFMFCSCKNKNKHLLAEKIANKTDLSSQNQQYLVEQQKVLEDFFSLPQADSVDFALSNNMPLYSYNWSKEFYKENNFYPIWTNYNGLSEAGNKLYNILKADKQWAIISPLYRITVLDSLIQNKDSKNIELLMMDNYMLLAYHLDSGAYDLEARKINLPRKSISKKYVELLTKSLKDGNIDGPLEALNPSHILFKRLFQAYTTFISKNNLLPKDFNIRDYKTDSVGCMKDVAKALVYHKYLNDSTSKYSANVVAALKRFQKDGGLEADGTPGNNTRKALMRDYYDQYRILLLNIDRWRGTSIETLPEKYIWSNIPSFVVLGIERDSIKDIHNAVVGTPKTQTPNIISAIDKIVLFPEWSIPQSIIKNEMKGKSVGYLNKYKIYQNGKKINASQINWSKPVRMVQPSGMGNSLGIMKFLFPNKHSVYLHDTPSKSLFNNEVRAYSHGCVRVEKPLGFGAYILQLDGQAITLDSLDTLIKKRKSITFKLNKTLPIFIQYFTAFSDYNNKLHFYTDIYDIDEKAVNILYKTSMIYSAMPPPKPKIDSIALKKDSILKAQLKIKKDSISKLLKTQKVDSIATLDTIAQ